MDDGSRASLAFTGTGVSWIIYKDAWFGIANVYIDNGNPRQLDTGWNAPHAGCSDVLPHEDLRPRHQVGEADLVPGRRVPLHLYRAK